MNKRRVINLIIFILFAVLVIMIAFLVGKFLESKGLLYIEFMGITVNSFTIIFEVMIIGFILYDFTSIRVKRKKYGELKYILKSNDKTRQIIFIIMIIFLFVQVVSLTNGFKKIDAHIMMLLYYPTPIIFLYVYHNIEKEGLGEEGVYYWGDVLTWDKVLRYNFKEDKLILTISKRSFGKIEKYEILFIVNGNDKIEIEEFLCEKGELIAGKSRNIQWVDS